MPPIKVQDNQTSEAESKELQSNSYRRHKTTQVIILDIPLEFSRDRIQRSLKKYGQISNLQIENGNNSFKTVHVTFNPTKLDLNKTWAIPMDNTIARILPYDNFNSTLAN